LLLLFSGTITGNRIALFVGYIKVYLKRSNYNHEHIARAFYSELFNVFLTFGLFGILAGVLIALAISESTLIKKIKFRYIFASCILLVSFSIFSQAYLEARMIPPLIASVHNGNLDGVKATFKKNGSINIKDAVGQTALMVSSQKGSIGITDFLVKNRAQVNLSDNSGSTALMNAVKLPDTVSYSSDDEPTFSSEAEINKVNLMKVLIEAGADVNIQNIRKRTALMMAIERESQKVVNLLIASNADVNSVDRNGRTALMIACMNGSIDKARILLDKGSQVNLLDDEGSTALMKAVKLSTARNNHNVIGIIELLIQSGANINTKNFDGLTPLMMAASNGNEVIVKHLVIKVHARIDELDKYGNDALSHAKRFKRDYQAVEYDKVIKYLTNEKRKIKRTQK
jgi:uncharacterized protein